jgi:hypothetical protein
MHACGGMREGSVLELPSARLFSHIPGSLCRVSALISFSEAIAIDCRQIIALFV